MFAFRHTSLSIPAERVWLDGVLAHAPDVRAVVVLLQNGCILHSDLRQAMIARRLEEARYATLSIDLLTRYEETRDPDSRFNVPLMNQRLLAVLEWLDHQPQVGELALALAASGTTCAAALRVAARRVDRVEALVCRGGRPDLAGAAPLRKLMCPTRFIVGGADPGLERYQKPAYDLLATRRDWQLIEGADEDFRSPGALEQATRLTLEWIESHLPGAAEPAQEVSP